MRKGEQDNGRSGQKKKKKKNSAKDADIAKVYAKTTSRCPYRAFGRHLRVQ
jgi:hypothetical protein